jgi:hypothetical protein
MRPIHAVLALSTCVAIPLRAQIPQATPVPIKVATIEADADARVQGGAPTVNYATGPLWFGNPDKTVFVHFPVKAKIPSGASIVEATVLLTFPQNAYSGNGNNSIQIGRVQANWSESGVTYASMPSVGWNGGARTVNGPAIVSWDVTPVVRDWLTNNIPNQGFALRGDGPLKEALSREAPSTTDRPRLRVRYVEP